MKRKKDLNEFPFAEKSLEGYLRKTVIKDINEIKSQIIDDVSQNKHKALKKPQDFLNKVNDTLKFWHNYGLEAIKAIESLGVLDEPRKGLSYGFVKQFMFNEFDFKSILMYTDSILNDAAEQKNFKQEYIDSLYEDSISVAFKTDFIDIDSLLNATDINQKMESSDEEQFDPKMIKTFDLFKEADYTDLYKAVEGIIDFINTDRLKVLFQLKKKVKHTILVSQIIKSIFDYMIYSICFFVTRIYLLSTFIGQYLGKDKLEQFSEAVITPNDSLDDFLKKMVIFKSDTDNNYWYDNAIFASMDEDVARDMDKTKFFEMFKTFMNIHGIKFSDDNHMYMAKFESDFKQYFKDSKLFDFMVNNDPDYFIEKINNPSALQELFIKMKYLLNTPKIGLVLSRKHVHNHRSVFYDLLIKATCVDKENLASLKKSAELMYRFAHFMFDYYFMHALKWVNNWGRSEYLDNEYNNSFTGYTTDSKLFSMLNNFISAFYDEMSYMIFKIMQFIETKIYYYENEATRTGKAYDKTSKPDNRYLHPIGVFNKVVMDEQEIFNESLNPANWNYLFDHYENQVLYENYIATLPGFDKLSYFTEEKSFIDWLHQIIDALCGRAVKFFKDGELATHVDWLMEHKNDFTAACFDEAEVLAKKDNRKYAVDKVGDFRLEDIHLDFTPILEEIVKEVSGETFEQYKERVFGNKDTGATATFFPDWVRQYFDTNEVFIQKFLKYTIFYNVDYKVFENMPKTDANAIEEKTHKKLESADDIKKLALECLKNLDKSNYTKMVNYAETFEEKIRNVLSNFKESFVSASIDKDLWKFFTEDPEQEVQSPTVESQVQSVQQPKKKPEESIEPVSPESTTNNNKIPTYQKKTFIQRILHSILLPVFSFFPTVYIEQYKYLHFLYENFLKYTDTVKRNNELRAKGKSTEPAKK